VAVLALWQTAARALVRAARELGLKLGRDLDVVGWALEEHFDTSYARDCPELRESCAAASWSMADVSRTVLNRIAERRREPDLPAARIMLPMKLREPGKVTGACVGVWVCGCVGHFRTHTLTYPQTHIPQFQELSRP
jgi:hypothetical protein